MSSSSRVRLVASALCVAVLLSLEARAAAQASPDPLDFNARYGRYTVWEGIATGAAAALTIGFVFVSPREHGQSTNGVDEGMRDLLRVSSRSGRATAALISDVLVASLWSYQALVDPLLVSWAVHGEPDTAAQILLINTEVQLLTAALQGVTTAIAGRERPLARDCANPEESLGADSSPCAGRDRRRSFFSGHTSQAFAAASAQCMHHLHLPLYGGVSPALPCASGYAVAALVGALRMMADRHYFTDVLVGAGVGTLIGLLVPWLFHYRAGARPGDGSTTSALNRELVLPSGPMVSFGASF